MTQQSATLQAAGVEALLARTVVTCILLFAAISKIWAFGGEANVVIPLLARLDGVGPLLSIALIAAELLVVAMTLSSKYWTSGLWLTVLLGCLFGIFLLIVDLSGNDVSSCGCFGGIPLDFNAHLALLIGMVSSALLALRSQERLQVGRES